MKHFTLLITLLSCVFLSKAQDEIYTIVEEMPIYKGCEDKEGLLNKQECTTSKILGYIAENTVYIKEAKEKGIEGYVFVIFVINEQGEVENARVVKGLPEGELLEKESLRVVNSLPTFIPGRQKGEAVKVQYTVPIKFKLEGKKKNKKRKKRG